MLEEIGNKENKKKTTKHKDSVITEQYQFNEDNVELITDIPSENSIKTAFNAELIMDKPSVPIIKIIEPILDVKKSEPLEIKNDKKIIKSNKELYESIIKELKNYSLNINDDIIYNSSIDKSKEYPVRFENDYFILYGKKYSYNGLKVKKIN